MKHWVTYSFLVFIIFSTMLCLWAAIRYYEGKEWGKVEQSYQVKIMRLEQQREAVWTSHFKCDSQLIQTELDQLSIFKELDDYNPDICLLLLPNVCSACAKEQSMILLNYVSRFNRVAIICPQFKKRDYQVQFSDVQNLCVFSYDYEKLASKELQELDDVLLFRIQHHEVFQVIVTVKDNPEWIEKYYQFICPI